MAEQSPAKLEWHKPTYRIVEERGVSIERLHELFELNREKGVLTRKIAVGRHTSVGDIAGYPNNYGYLVVEIDGRKFLISRIIYAMNKGEWPFNNVDHSDEDRTNNRPDNLRNATHGENRRNISKRKSNTSGLSGAGWDKRKNKWRARIHIGGKEKYLGYYIDKVAASLAVDIARLQYHGQFARLNDPYGPFFAMRAMMDDASLMSVLEAPILTRLL
jgi:hypothetical protein